MSEVSPVEIPIDCPPFELVPTHTAFFRKKSLLPEALDAVFERVDADQPLRILSAACSAGPEAYSLLALYQKSSHRGKVALKGVDINDDALEMAQAGKYKTVKMGAKNAAQVRPTLWDYDVDVAGMVCSQKRELEVSFLLDATGLIGENELVFEKANIINDDLGRVRGNDLVMANQVLFHLEPEQATVAARNLAAAVEQTGVLSFGDWPTHRFIHSETSEGIQYCDWLKQTGVMLEEDFGFRPIYMGRLDAPVMFSRS